MFFRKFIWLFGLLLIGGAFFLNSRQDNAYQNGYAQGYIAGQQSVISEDGATAVAPAQQPITPAPVRGDTFFSVLFKMFVFFFGFMLFIGLMFRLFGGKHWRHHGRHWHGWQKDWHQEWHGRPPRWEDDLKDEPVMKA